MNIFKDLLTFEVVWLSLGSSHPHDVIGIGVPNPQRRKPLSCGFFMRESSVHHFVGLGKTAERLASSLGWYANLTQSDTIIGVMLSGFKTLPTEAIKMPNKNAQELSILKKQTNSVSLNSLFSIKNNHKTIAKNLSFNDARAMAKSTNSLIKFQRMASVSGSLL
ncbi:MAG: hypothetical protein V3U87_17840 [Methylococcaceae bacterium]